MYLLSFYDKETAEFIPVGLYSDKALAEKHMKSEPGVRWNLLKLEVDKFDYETFNTYN